MKPIPERKKRYVLKHFNDPCIGKDRLASELGICKKSVYNINSQLKDCKRLYNLPKPKKCGRKQHVFTVEETDIILKYRNQYKVNCNTLERLLKRKEKIELPHNQIYKILKIKGLIHVQKPKKKRNAWIRFERKHSLSLFQMDWSKMHDGTWLLAIKDDASRLIVAKGVFPEATSDHSIEVLTQAIQAYGKPLAILTGRDVQFYASDKLGKPSGKNRFQQFLEANEIKHILARVNHPQTCGKIERTFGEIKNRLYKWHDFDTIDKVVDWHNNLLPSMSLDYENLETPAQAFQRKMHHNRKITKEVILI